MFQALVNAASTCAHSHAWFGLVWFRKARQHIQYIYTLHCLAYERILRRTRSLVTQISICKWVHCAWFVLCTQRVFVQSMCNTDCYYLLIMLYSQLLPQRVHTQCVFQCPTAYCVVIRTNPDVRSQDRQIANYVFKSSNFDGILTHGAYTVPHCTAKVLL